MNPNQRKQLIQIIVLVVLLVGLGFSMWRMVQTVNPPRQQQSAASQPAAQQAPAGGVPSSTAPSAQPPATPPAGATAEGEGIPVAVPDQIEMNPNLFRVYQLDSPKNPFKQEESWYKEELEQIPGYPELRDSGFLDTMSPVVPDLSELLGDDENWQEIQLIKTQLDKQYSITGSSEDDLINTALTFKGPEGREVNVTWTPGTGVPLSALNDPNWQQKYNLQPGQIPANMPPDEDLFLPPAAGEGLKIPGIDEVITGGVVPGDQVYCHGINILNGRAYALVSFNGTTRLVQEGDSLPPRYTVEAITGDGAVLFNLRTEQTQWLPIRAPMPQDAGSGGAASAPTGASGTAATPMPAPIIPVGGQT